MAFPFVAYHDRSHIDHQQQWNTLVPKGFRPISLSVYGDRANPLYAAIWVQRPGPAFAGIHGATAANFQKFFDSWAAKGFSPTILSATGPANNPVFAAIMEQSKQGVSLTRYGLTTGSVDDPNTLEHWLKQAHDDHRIPRWIATYGTPADRRFTLVLDPNPGRVLWSVAGQWGEDATGYQARFNAHVQQWARPGFVTVAPDATYLSLFREDSIGGWVARHNMTSQQYQQAFNENTAKGLFPVCVQAGGSGSSTRFAALFATRDTPLARSFTATGTAVPSMSFIDTNIRNFMVENGTRAIGVAVVKDGRLVFARGYTWAEADYPLTQPTSVFRIASCTKPLTSLAIFQLIQQKKLALTDTVQSILNLTPPPGMSIHADFKTITVQHLLNHLGGWDRSKVSDLPPLEDISKAYNLTSLPLTKQQLASYKASLPLQFSPATQQEYSNLGYLLLGMIIEKKVGIAYDDAVKQRVFSPLGLKRPHRTPVAQSAQHTGSVRHHDSAAPWDDLRIYPSAVAGNPQGARPLVPLPYGGEDYALFDAFGGWCMAPVDYAKVLASLMTPNNPLLDQPTLEAMLTIPTALYKKASSVDMPNYANGWDSWIEANGVRGYQHGGGMPGVSTRILYRTDGWGFVIFSNEIGAPDLYPDLANMASAAWPMHNLFTQVDIPV
ncbi:serine hydrolase [Spirosoma aerophilum]